MGQEIRTGISPGKDGPVSLINKASVGDVLAQPVTDEEAWIEVIQKMDSVYAELVNSQAELEKKNAELENAQKFISSVLSSMTDILIVCDPDGKIQQVNAALEHLTGYREQSLLGRPLEYVFSDDCKLMAAEMPEHMRSNEPISDCEISVIDAEGESVPLSVNCSSRFDHKGRTVGVVLIGRPVGELRRAYKELDQAHHTLREAQQQLVFSEKMAALGRLVAGVAHELNNPISFVFGNMHALKSYGEKLTTYLKAVEKSSVDARLQHLGKQLNIGRITSDIMPLVEGTLEGAERVSDIVQELRRFSGTQKEAADEFALSPLVETAVNWVLRGAKRKPAITTNCPPGLRVFARKGYVHQIIINLVQNAVDVLEEESEAAISIDCKSSGNDVVIAIKDNGPGISEQDIDHIFEPFFTTKPIGQGTGLGLYVSYNMAEEIGGDLSGENITGKGAVFRLSLPARSGVLSND